MLFELVCARAEHSFSLLQRRTPGDVIVTGGGGGSGDGLRAIVDKNGAWCGGMKNVSKKRRQKTR